MNNGTTLGKQTDEQNQELAVTVGFLIGKKYRLPLANGEKVTVQELLARAEIDAGKHNIRIDGQPATIHAFVHAGQEVLLVKEVRGNN